MIPLHKLAQLPRSQRLRKAANLVRGAERRFVFSGGEPQAFSLSPTGSAASSWRLKAGEAEYFEKLVKLLAEDEAFPQAAAEALRTAYKNLVDYRTDEKEIRRTLNTVHQVLLAETGRYQADWDFFEPAGALDSSKRHIFHGMQVYFEDIRSPFNVGSMFRAAESFGTEKIWLSTICASPLHKRTLRTAMGCVDAVPWEFLSNDPFEDHSALPIFQGPCFALETGGTPLADFSFPACGILIAGSEELGVSPRALAAADASLGRVSIPTWGAKGSLNVAGAFAIVMHAWAAQIALDFNIRTAV
jgi:TrmH family RNA methyltransferase